ncbi:MAG TPA: TatD family hydrolase [Candidatus Paceibacterota bacterium]|nr:TatD family hydrolase [Candidatus Paceibacterota bacterium]
MRFFDAHTHVNFAAFKDDMDAAIGRAADAGVGMNIVGTQFDTSKSAVEVAEKYDDVYATIGLHPIHTGKSYHDEKELGEGGKAFTSRGEVFDVEKYRALAASPKVIAIGECGLDYYRLDADSKKIQEQAFIEQIELANALQKPLMLHIRASQGSDDAYEDALDILKAHAKVKGNSHFFAGSWDTAKKYLDFGVTLSFTGVLTFTHDYDEIVKHAPLDMLLSETDAPYVTPVPHRGKRNEPAYVIEVVRAIARIRGEDEHGVREQLLANAARLFGLK